MSDYTDKAAGIFMFKMGEIPVLTWQCVAKCACKKPSTEKRHYVCQEPDGVFWDLYLCLNCGGRVK